LLAAFNYVELFHDNYFDGELYPLLSGALKQFTEERTAQSQKSSKTHMHVQKMLEKMVGRKLQKEQFINGYYADIVLNNTNSDRHLVEIQGPTHYLQSGSDTGDHFLRTRILNALGYRVTDLRVVEWGACIVHNKGKFNHRATVQKQRAFLKKKLAESIQRVPLLQQKEEGKAVKKEEGKATVPTSNGSTVQGHTTPLLLPK
jgi:very-short-patch-repair endonuclease